MNNSKFLNLGCGNHFHSEWVNVDFAKTGEKVIVANLLDGIPFIDDSFKMVYHSHVLEHFSKNDGQEFIKECYRVLKPGGILRVAIPDLEQINLNYLKVLEEAKKNPQDVNTNCNYDWMLIEMYDQTVRDKSGGEMMKFLQQKDLPNESFIYNRIGMEGKSLRNNLISNESVIDLDKDKQIKKSENQNSYLKLFNPKSYIVYFRNKFKGSQRHQLKKEHQALGKFRRGGEVHLWMYDQFSLKRLLVKSGFRNVHRRNAVESFLPNWANFQLDMINGEIRKPDSLFMEAIK